MSKKLLGTENKIQDISFKIKSVDKVNNTVEGIFSSEVEDRQGEIVVQKGWLLENYMKNPVVLWAHKSDQPPIAKMLEIGVNPATNQLEGKMQFAVAESAFALEIFNLIIGGYQKAFSAGFINNRYEIDQENEKVYLLENELLEVSAVPVPANQLSLAKSKGYNVGAYEKTLTDLDDPHESDDITDDDDEDDTEVSEKEALERISKSNIETIHAAIATLTDVVKAHEADTAKAKGSDKVEHPVKAGGKNKVSVRLINRAIRELLTVKKSL